MSLFERIAEKNINLTEQPFSDKQKSDMKNVLNKNFGSKKKSKETAGKVIKDTAKKDVGRYFAKSKSKSKGGGASTGGSKLDFNVSNTTGSMKDKMRSIEGDKQSNKIRAEIEGQTGKKTRDFTQKAGTVTTGNEKPRTVKQSEVSKKAKEFTSKINKRRAKRIKDATGGKKTGSLRKGNLSFPGDKSGAYKATKTDIETRKGFSKNKPGGLKADETNKFVKRSVRKTRVDKIGGDIYDQPKFSQKGFEKSLGKKPSTTSAPKGLFGSGITKGQANVKAMDKKSFKLTQPKDITLPKSFTDFSKKIKAYREIEKKVSKPSYSIKSKGGGASTGGSKPVFNVSNTTGSMKGGSKPKNGSSSAGGGGGKPPKTPKGGTLGFPNPPEDGTFKGKIPKKPKVTGDAFDNLGNRTKTQFGKIRNTKAFDVRYNKMKNLKSTPKALRPLKPAGKAILGAAKKNPTTAALLGLGALAYGGYKAFGPKPKIKDTLSDKDFTKVTKTGIVNKKGEQVRRKLNFGKKVKNQKPQETVSSMSKKVKSDNTGEYRVK